MPESIKQALWSATSTLPHNDWQRHGPPQPLGETWTINSTAIALPARIHGARDLYMGTAAGQPYLRHDVDELWYTNAVAANYFSTPDQAITTADIDIKIRCSRK